MAMSAEHISQLALKHRTLLLLLLGALLYVAFLGLRDLWYPDEPDIAEVARAMFRSGDWIRPRRMGEIWVDYPPMIYWVGTISSHLLGDMSAFSLRLPNALAAIGTVLMTGFACSRWFGARAGLWAGISLLTFLGFVYEANSYRPDVLFTLTITAGMLLYAEGADDRARFLLRAAAFACFGLALLSKGPLGLLLPGLALVMWQAFRRKWRRIFEMAPLSLIAVAVYLPWFVATAEGMGWNSILYEFYAQNLERFLTSEYRGHGQPWFYYLRNFWLDFMPWSWLVPPAVWWLVRSGRHRDPKIQLAFWWFGAFIAFLSIAATKRQLYLLPAYPAVALLLAPWLATVGRPMDRSEVSAPDARPVRWYSMVLGILYPFLGFALFVAVANLGRIIAGADLNEQVLEIGRTIPVPLVVLGVVLLMSGFWIGFAWKNQDARAAIRRIGAAHIALYVVILAVVMPAFAPVKTYRPQSLWISETIGDETHFGMVDPAGIARRGGFAYYTGTLVDLLEGPREVEQFFEKHPGSVVLIDENSVDDIFAGREAAWENRVMRDIRVGRHVYRVVRGPQTK
jgi:4-amino-4-deoxy-L-arabinose transferase-like glycosyltransferase